MASIFNYTKRLLIQRITRHLADGYPNEDFPVTDNEVNLYIDECLAFNLVGQVYGMAKVLGNLVVPEGYLTTYGLSLTQDTANNEWYATLPQPPISLPLGYSISRCYLWDAEMGDSEDLFPVEAKRAAFRKLMPPPPGGRYRVENYIIRVTPTGGTGLTGFTLKVQMAKTRTEDVNELMALPDDAIQSIFDKVVEKILQRFGVPKDILKDGLPSGNKQS